jgi:tRNA A-37 threonylcarbamoyl transferase component Bud32
MLGQLHQYEHFEIQTDAAGAPVLLSSTGHGLTYRATDTRLRKAVALKIVEPSLVADEKGRAQFFKEARAAAAIEHPNIARITYVCPDDASECFYAVELVEGQSLGARVQSKGPMVPELAFQTLRPIADALVTLGQNGLVHRDIQPDNVVLTSEGTGLPTIKLIDFGFDKSTVSEPEALDPMQTAALRSSTYHFSPEQIRGEHALDSRSDFYSLGVTVWHALVGHPPFTGSPGDVTDGHLHREIAWSELPVLPQPALALLRSLLAKKREARPQNAMELVELWDAALAGFKTRGVKSVVIAKHPSGVMKIGAAAPADGAGMADAPTNLLAKPLLRLVRVPGSQAGCASPPPVGYLARGDASKGMFFVRALPEKLKSELRKEFLGQARMLLSAPHTAFLNVCDVRGDEVVSEWQRGISAARLLSTHGGALPEPIVTAWLPGVAQAVDYAREHSLSRIGLGSGQWLVEFLDLGPEETPAERANRPPAEWGRQRVWLDPLAGFDDLINAANADASHTAGPPGSAPLTDAASYAAAVAKTVHELLGGAAQVRPAPLPPIDETRNTLLLDAIHGRSAFPSAREWVAAFIAREEPVRSAPPSAVKSEPANTASTVALAITERAQRDIAPPARPRAVSASSRGEIPPATAPVRPPPKPSLSLAARWRRLDLNAVHALLGSPAFRWAGLATAVIFLVVIVVLALPSAPTGRTLPPAARPAAPGGPLPPGQSLATEARGALESGNLELAQQKITALALASPNDPGLPELRKKLHEGQAQQRRSSPAAPLENLSPAARVTGATKVLPFVNSLGMKLVPVPITGGRNAGKTVLFSVHETRVSDFEKFAQAGKGWMREQYQESGDHPAIRVRAIDAVTFCQWLTKLDQKAGAIPEGWYYQLPSDHEWSCAAGLGAFEDPALSAKTKGANPPANLAPELTFPWGAAWPPPAGAGNFAGEETVAAKPAQKRIERYHDNFRFTAPVGRFLPNELGLYDLAGNAAEWCEDYHEGSLPLYLLRGGHWGSCERGQLVATARLWAPVEEFSELHGLRVMLAESKPRPYPQPTGGAGSSSNPAAPNAAQMAAAANPQFQPPSQAAPRSAQLPGPQNSPPPPAGSKTGP